MTDFENVKNIIEEIYNSTLDISNGKVADYIPQLANVNPELYGISVCTVHGEFFNIGDTTVPFSLQSCSKPLNYCIVKDKDSNIHSHVGYEPSGRAFNAHTLNDDGLPHNPMINAGAMMVAHFIEPAEEPANRFEKVREYYSAMAGNIGEIGFNNGVYLSEKLHADRNISLAYYMRENGAFGKPPPSPDDLQQSIDLYFQCCSMSITTKIGSVIASTLANGGICPVTGEEVCTMDTVRDCLCLMFFCGMYDFSGQFAFEIGLPAKSGVSGCILLVIPNEMGICIYSPRLDKNGNSVRGIEFCKQFIKKSPKSYHIFQSIFSDLDKSVHFEDISEDNKIMLKQLLISSASNGDISSLHKLEGKIDFNEHDYDKRTALHLAAAEAEVETVKYLLSKNVKKHPQDRWGNTPYHEAIKGLHEMKSDEPTKEMEIKAYEEICKLLET